MTVCQYQLCVAVCTTYKRCTGDVVEKLVKLSSLERLEILLIVQGGSPFISGEHQQWLDKSDNVRVIVSTKVGVNFSRNESLRRSRARYVAFLDDDIEPNQEFFYRTMKKISAIKVAGIILVCDLNFSSGRPKIFTQREHVYDIATAVGAPNLIIPSHFMQENGIVFDESIGAGRFVPFGDEFLVCCRAIKFGASMLILEDAIGVHGGRSSVERLNKLHWVAGLLVLAYRLGAKDFFPVLCYKLSRFFQKKQKN